MRYLNLASGAAHFKSPEIAVQKTVEALQSGETFYGDTEGLPALRKAIAKRYQKDYQTTVPEKNILITAGTKQALFNLFSILLKPGDEVILPTPGWFGFTEILKLLQVRPVFLETEPEKDYAIDPEILKNLITENTRLFIFSNPGNPTGKIYSFEEIKTWLKVLEKYPEVKILSDEIYDLILFDNAAIPSLVQFPDPDQKHLVVNGFSKNFAMSGWRIGYLIAPQQILEKAVHFQHTTISGVNPFIQEGAVAVLESRNSILPERILELSRNREILCNWLSEHSLFSFFFPQAAYYVFADLRQLLLTDYCQENGINSGQKFCEYIKEKYQVEFQPGEKFNTPGFIRITFAVIENDLNEALNRLDMFLLENKISG